MCGPIIGALIGLAGSLVSSQMQASATAAQAQQEAAVRKQQLKIEMENEKIKSLTETNNRIETFLKQEAANRAALSASGLSSNFSYNQGIEPYNKRVVGRDVARQQYNSNARIANSKYNIKVVQAEADATAANARATANAESIGAAFSTVGNIISM